METSIRIFHPGFRFEIPVRLICPESRFRISENIIITPTMYLQSDTHSWCGGDSIDLVKHLTGFGFVLSVMAGFDEIETKQEFGR